MTQRYRSAAILLAAATLTTLLCADANAQLRIVTYNTLQGPSAGMSTVLEAIGEEVTQGVARPIDILLLQEQDEPFTTTQSIVNLLNTTYGAGTYARTFSATGPSFSSLRQSYIYNTETVDLLQEQRIARTTQNGGQPPREALRAKFRPVGYDERSDFYVYNSHFKAGSNSSDFNRRHAEAINLRNDADAFGEGAHVIFGGDLNLRASTDLAFQELVSSGNAQAFDPADFPGQWKNNFGARTVHTHGRNDVDDRFDFLLPTLEWRDGEGLDVIEGSHHTFGNNGSTYNQAVNSAANTYDFDFGANPTYTKQTVLNALVSASDHLPVVADFQVPAVLGASFDELADQVMLGEPATLSLSVENVADVVAAIGADELDYSITWAGDDSGSLSGVDLADGVADTYEIPLDTSALGSYSTTFTIASDSPGVVNADETFALDDGLLEFTVAYDVVASTLPGDFNQDGFVDAGDYTVLRPLFSAGELTAADYVAWLSNYGASSQAVAVPEPTAALLLVLSAATIAARGRPV